MPEAELVVAVAVVAVTVAIAGRSFPVCSLQSLLSPVRRQLCLSLLQLLHIKTLIDNSKKTMIFFCQVVLTCTWQIYTIILRETIVEKLELLSLR